MSEQVTEERIKMILSKREKMLRDINEKVILLIKDLDRIDDDLITEKKHTCSKYKYDAICQRWGKERFVRSHHKTAARQRREKK